MWIRPAKTKAIRFLGSVIALAAILMGGALPGTSLAESWVSTVIGGKSITVMGGSNQSINSTRRKTIVVVDGRKIVIGKGRIRVAKQDHDIGRFSVIKIDARGEDLMIYVDGRLLK